MWESKITAYVIYILCNNIHSTYKLSSSTYCLIKYNNGNNGLIRLWVNHAQI
jgi:hypothetical protein